MSNVVEVLYTSDQSDEQWTCCAWDYKTATNLMVYKGGGISNSRSLCISNNTVLSANGTKPLFHVWTINSQEQISSARLVAPGKANAVAISPDGNYMVAGVQESLYIWQICSGRLLANISKHYQAVTCIKFTDDGSHFASAGLDGGVMVWSLAQVISKGDSNQEPLYAFNDHGLSVTDVYIGSGGIRSYMYSVSIDRTCKVYDLSSGCLLLNVVFTESLSCVATNILETSVHVGTTEGLIYEFHISSLPRTKEYHISKENMNKYLGHKGGVTCMALSIDGETLVSGGQDGLVHVWNIPSKQLIRSLPHRGPITNVIFTLKKLSVFSPENSYPNPFVNNLKRMMNSSDDEELHTVEICVNEQSEESTYLSGPTQLVQLGVTAATPSNDEMEKLRQEIKTLKDINRELFAISTKKILNV